MGGNPSADAEWPVVEQLSQEDWDLRNDGRLSKQEIASQDRYMLQRQQDLRLAAEAVAAAMGQLDEVQRVVLFGSVAKPLKREVPRFREYRRAGIETWHECKDVDLPVWVCDLACLRALQKARSRGLIELLASRNVGVAHHQIDEFILEPGTDRYLGRLCVFAKCPNREDRCCVEGCGAVPFLQQHEDLAFDWAAASQGSVLLFQRK